MCDNDRQWSVYCFKIKVCQIQVLHGYRNYDGNKFEKKNEKFIFYSLPYLTDRYVCGM